MAELGRVSGSPINYFFGNLFIFCSFSEENVEIGKINLNVKNRVEEDFQKRLVQLNHNVLPKVSAEGPFAAEQLEKVVAISARQMQFYQQTT